MNNELTNHQNTASEMINFNTITFDLKKKYLENEIEVIPIERLKEEVLLSEFSKEEIRSKIRFFKLEKFVFEKDIKISHKLKSVFTALHSVNSTVIFKIVSNGKECQIFIGVKSGHKVSEKAKVLKGALKGNFPGTSLSNDNENISNDEVIKINNTIFENSKEITAVLGVPSIKDKEEDQFIQGVENLILGMNGKPFSAFFIADPVAANLVELSLDAYEQIYSVLSSEKEFVVTDGTNTSLSRSTSRSTSQSNSISNSETNGVNESTSTNSSPWIGRKMLNGLFGTGSKNASNISKGLESIIEAYIYPIDETVGRNVREVQKFIGHTQSFKIKADLKTKSEGSKTKGTNQSNTISESESKSSSESTSVSNSSGISNSKQKTFTNKKVSNFLDQLDQQIKRLEQGKGIGFWNVGAYFVSDEEQNSIIAANIYNGVIKGAESAFETAAVKTFNSINNQEREKIIPYLQRYEIPRLKDFNFLAQAITTDELTVQINLPHKSVIGLDVVEITPFGNNLNNKVTDNIKIGNLYNYEQILSNEILLDYNKFTSHVFVTGSTGSGKSNVTYNLIDNLNDKGVNFLVIEPAKGEYKDEFGGREDVFVYGTNETKTELLKINPFAFPQEIHVYEHIDRFIEILNACWPMEAAMPNILKEAVEDAYISKGWLLDKSICVGDNIEFPLFSDLLISLENVIAKSKFSTEIKSNYEGALVSRVRSMTNGLNKLIFSNDYIADADLFDKNVIVDLSRVASSEGKALFMGLLFMKLNEYRVATKTQSNSNLKHITIIEEAHNLLKRTSSDQSADSSNLAGKSVEMISNAIAEMRTYGEGFIIADQAPGLLDMSVIRNTNTKICLRLPDFEDRKLVGNAMNLSEEQIKALATLDTGVAAIYQNDWQETILCKFHKFQSKGKAFNYVKESSESEKVYKVLDIISNYELTKKIKEEEVYLINEVIALDFLLRQEWDESKSTNYLKITLLKKLMSITGLDRNEVEPILKYIVHLLRRKDYKSKLTNIKI